MTRISQAFAKARGEDRAAFIPYLTAGDPSAATTVRLACALEQAGADVIELGVPFSDPIADGPVLQRSAQRALRSGTTFGGVLRVARRIRRETGLPLLLFTYANPLLRYGIRRAAIEAAAAGVSGILVTDLPPEEARPVRGPLRRAGLDTVFLVAPSSSEDRMARAASLSSGFLYVVSRAGTTGVRDGLPADLSRTVGRARRAAGKLPIAVGFGIASPDAASAAARLADGVVVGSALVAAMERSRTDPVRAVSRLARAMARSCHRER
ncbi:MAG: tryptophan synthase subunit alpha [Thermoanaerobaculia bacterium]